MITRIIEYSPDEKVPHDSSVDKESTSSHEEKDKHKKKIHRTVIRVSLPINRYDAIMKALQQNNDYIIALGGNFNLNNTGTSHHYSCTQNPEGQHVTRVIGICSSSLDDNHESCVNVTRFKSDDPSGDSPSNDCCSDVKKMSIGASFIVFSGALKSSTGLNAKSSIVEDGIMIQIPAHHVATLKSTLKDKKDYVINCSKVSCKATTESPSDDGSPSSESTCETPSEVISLEWVSKDSYFNVGVRSPIDGKCLEGIPSVRIHNGTDYSHGKFLIRWTEVFIQTNDDNKR